MTERGHPVRQLAQQALTDASHLLEDQVQQRVEGVTSTP